MLALIFSSEICELVLMFGHGDFIPSVYFSFKNVGITVTISSYSMKILCPQADIIVVAHIHQDLYRSFHGNSFSILVCIY